MLNLRPARNAQLRRRKWVIAYLVLALVGFGSAQTPEKQESGSVPSGAATADIVRLTLDDALAMSMRNNLRTIESGEQARIASAQRLLSLSRLLPQIDARIAENVAQASLATTGFLKLGIPGVPPVIGPYSYSEAAVELNHTLFSYPEIQRLRGARSAQDAARLSNNDVLEAVTLVTGTAYFQVVASRGRVDAAEAQVKNAQAIYGQAAREFQAGTKPKIDVTRSLVQLHTEQYNLSVARNAHAVAKLTLGRIIGLPLGQEFDATDELLYSEANVPSLEDALRLAVANRDDLRAGLATVAAAEATLSAAKGERYPAVTVKGTYSDIGPTFGQSRGAFAFGAGVSIPIFTGGRIQAEILQAEATLRQRRAEAESLRGQVDFDVRTAFLDLQAAREQVEVARQNLTLATETLTRSQDRFAAGVTDSVEVVQAEQSVASANEQHIASLFNHNVTRFALARATGLARMKVGPVAGGYSMTQAPTVLSRRQHLVRGLRTHPIAAPTGIVLLAILLLGCGLFVKSTLRWESTDDAQVDGAIYPISARVRGHILSIAVRDNQYVEAGSVLAEVDPADYAVAVRSAQAQLADAEANAASLRFNLPVTSVTARSGITAAAAGVAEAEAAVHGADRNLDSAKAAVEQAQANAAKSHADLSRYRALIEKEDISRQRYDEAVAADQVSIAQVAAARAAAQAAEESLHQMNAKVLDVRSELRKANTATQQVSAARSKLDAAEADVLERKAQLAQAELNLRYTKIVAPVSGVVYKRSSVQPGANVEVGQQLMTVIPLDQVWVTANFKETQLKHMRVGQTAEIAVDAYGRKYRGHIDGIGPGTGALFSLFPPENATGNYVKVVQRISIKIVLDAGQNEDQRLRPGMSVEADIRVR
jgi:membrane fusion protein, multidrug efflux system